MENLKTTYNSNDNILEDFFKHYLREYKNVKICSAYFSSSLLIDLFEELNYQLSEGGTFHLIIGEETSDEEILKLQTLVHGDEGEFIFEKLFSNLSSENFRKFDALRKHIETGAFVIKVGKTKKENSIFHNKLYIFHNSVYDFGIAASGSLNFTKSGMFNNYENLVVRESITSFQESMREFEELWNDSFDGTSVLPILDYVVTKVGETIEELYPPYKVDPPNGNGLDDDPLPYTSSREVSMQRLRDYQLEAIGNIKDNNYNGILKMATGTGKTFTAMGIINDIMFEDTKANIVHIAVPYQHLADQWAQELEEFFGNDIKTCVCHSGVPGGSNKWKQNVKNLMRVKSHYKIALVFVNESYFNFLETVKIDSDTLLLVDEVHNLTTFNMSKELAIKNFQYRIGLSATPEDEFDEKRTETLFDYFDGIQYNFDLSDAIDNDFLTPYLYYPTRIELNTNEALEYIELDALINNEKSLSLRKKLEEQQIEILSQAEKKILQFEKDILSLVTKGNTTNTIVYCSPGKLRKNLNISFISQINESIYNIDNGIHVNKITYEESAEKRQELTQKFKEKKLHMLCAVKCLDEGYNIPCIEKAFILYSTKRQREYIQRRGRLLRKFDGKEISVIYDYIIQIDGNMLPFEEKRFREYTCLAKNKDELFKEFYE